MSTAAPHAPHDTAPPHDPHGPHDLVHRPVHQERPTAHLGCVENPQETDMTFLAEDLARARRAQDLSDARTARLVGAIRRRRAAERSQARARRLVRLASLAAQRSENLASSGALTVAR
ncbi:hypothetical protein [Jannaschia sp. R86511]|uniref:hypothetical protein n=1 Tax=Jannaschia sp. R86511 TaxID=3093853 RepID=UPI0036D3A572